MSLVGFKGKNHPRSVAARGADDSVDDRATPVATFRALDAEHGFTIDVAASRSNRKCRRYFTKRSNGLAQSWRGEVVWCNPPYSDLGAWVRKAIREVRENGCHKVVMLLPANRTEQRWWQDHIEPDRDRGRGILVRFLRGRLKFRQPGKAWKCPPFGCVVVVVEPVRRRRCHG